jgi:uncharacterized protein YndB with AHSA1/START domain
MMMSHHATRVTAEPGKQELFIEREFDAPRDLVFKAYTDPKLYTQWLGPRGMTMDLEVFEPWSGGRWRYVSTDADGKEYHIHGVYHEVTRPERMIDTFEYDNLPESGHVSLEKAVFEELPGERTRVRTQSVFLSVAERDGMIGSNMEQGLKESFERLDELLDTLKVKM